MKTFTRMVMVVGGLWLLSQGQLIPALVTLMAMGLFEHEDERQEALDAKQRSQRSLKALMDTLEELDRRDALAE